MKYNRIAEDRSQLEDFSKKIEGNGWTSLGFIMLPVADEPMMTWEQYKEKYGIDLDKIFEVKNLGNDDTPEYVVAFREDFRKLVVLSYDGSSIFVPSVSIPTKIVNVSDSVISKAYATFQCLDRDENGGFSINIQGNRLIGGGSI